MRSSLFKLLLYIQVFVGMGAIGGGLPMIINPMGMSTEMLKGTPFSSFLVPGILLFLVNGLGSMAGAYCSYHQKRHAEAIAIVLGSALIIWMLVQLYFLGIQSWLQALFLILGITELVLGIILYKKR